MLYTLSFPVPRRPPRLKHTETKKPNHGCDWVLFLTMTLSKIRAACLLANAYDCQECHPDAYYSPDAHSDCDFLFVCHPLFLLLIKNAAPTPLIGLGLQNYKFISI